MSAESAKTESFTETRRVLPMRVVANKRHIRIVDALSISFHLLYIA
jgi:hypothetical protein